jgi:multisubunit Na+/H+ antiporter MnhG subunit
MLRAAGIGGSILVLIALAIALLTKLIAFIGFITWAVKILIIVVFIVVIASVGFMVLKSWQARRNPMD